MARVFLSHSSRDSDKALEIFEWLKARGFDQGFLDIDTHQGIPPGVKWEQKLYDELERAQAVILLLTKNWFDSSWCFAELALARSRGKAVFPVILSPSGDRFIGDDLQKLDLTKDRDGGLERLAARLTEVALSSPGGFALPPGRSPYPGFFAFDEQDAAVYFGREDDIRSLVHTLDARRILGARRLVLVLGASGTGKSSLLRAGIIPRLRKTQDWIVLSPIRPEADPLAGLRLSFEELGIELPEQEPGEIDLVKFSRDILTASRGPRRSAILVPIDQGEELFTRTSSEDRAEFARFLASLLSPGLPFVVVVTLRSDHLGDWQKSMSMITWEDFPLRPLPLDRLGEVIRGPAAVAGLTADERLIARIAADVHSSDALPLVALVLQRLYRSTTDGRLHLAEYEGLRDPDAGLSPLETVVKETATQTIADQNPTEIERLALRDAFVPALVKVNDEGGFVRQPARWEALPEASWRLVEALAGPQARLLVIRDENGIREVEVAHEALFQAWPELAGWLEEEREFLIAQNRLEKALADWRALPEVARDKGLLQGIQLERARNGLQAHPSRFSEEEATFIRASEQADSEHRRLLEEQRQALAQAKLRQVEIQRDGAARLARRTRVAAIILALLALGATGAGIAAVHFGNRAEANFEIANNTMQDIVGGIVLGIRDSEGIRLDNIASILSRVAEVVASLTTQAPDEPELLETTAFMQSAFGDTYRGSGNIQAAIAAYEEMLSTYRQLAAMEAGDAGWDRNVSVALNKLGELLRVTGHSAAAAAMFKESLEIRRRLRAGAPNEPEALDDLASALERVAMIEGVTGRSADARAAYQEAREIREELTRQWPDRPDFWANLATNLDRIGDLRLELGSSKMAMSAYSEALGIRRTLADSEPTNTVRLREVSIGLHKVGNGHLLRGDIVSAISAYEEALEIRRTLANGDPGNTTFLSDLATTYDRIGIVRLREGRTAQALLTHQKAFEIYSELVDKDPQNAMWLSFASDNLEKIGNTKLKLGDHEGASSDYEQSLTILHRLVEMDPENLQYLWSLSGAYKKVGDGSEARGDLQSAASAYEQCLAIRRRLVEMGPSDPRWQRELSVAIERTGEVAIRLGDRDAARAAYEESLAIRRTLVELDAEIVQWQVDVAVSLDHLRNVTEDVEGRRVLLTDALSILDKLASRDALSAEQIALLTEMRNALQEMDRS